MPGNLNPVKKSAKNRSAATPPSPSRQRIRTEATRKKLLDSAEQIFARDGFEAARLEDIASMAGYTRGAFYANFESKEECFLAAFDTLVGHVRELVEAAVEAEPDWPHQAIAAARSTLAFLAAEPDLARLCLVEAQSAGPEVAAHFHAAVRELVPPLRLGRGERPRGRELPESTEDSALGAIVSLASRKVAAGEAAALEDLLPDVAEFILAPYLGPDEATRLARPPA